MGTGSVTASSLNVRSGPGTSYSRIGSLTRGSVTVRSVSGDWAQIDYAGRTGYLHRLPGHQRQRRWFLRPYPSPDGAPPAKPGRSANSSLNVRSGPGTSYSRIGSLSQGATPCRPVLSVSGGWAKVSFSGRPATSAVITWTSRTAPGPHARSHPRPTRTPHPIRRPGRAP